MPPAIRINCGGGDYQRRSGELWARDRFYHGGRRQGIGFKRVVQGTEDEKLYQVHRMFSADTLARGYRIPLPTGVYRVTLLIFSEPVAECPERTVDVLLEGQVIGKIEGCEPWVLNFAPATAGRVTRDVRITDGVLELEFAPGGDGRIAAIEIVPRRSN